MAHSAVVTRRSSTSNGRGLAFGALFLVVALAAGGGVLLASAEDTAEDSGGAPDARQTDQDRTPSREASGDSVRLGRRYLRAACRNVPYKWIDRTKKGWVFGKSRRRDLALIPKPPNFQGTITDTSHSGPYAFLQNVPLTFLGGGVPDKGLIKTDRAFSLVDVAPTVAKMMGFDMNAPQGKVIKEVLPESDAPPKLVFTAVVDGAGWNDLRRWPKAWPNIRRLMREGTTLTNATTGSSPSITPAIHTNISTGAYPKTHGVHAINIRLRSGELIKAFLPDRAFYIPNMTARPSLKIRTLADKWDLRRGNKPKIGLLTPGTYQLGMVGHGKAIDGADRDLAVGLKEDGTWATNTRYYSMPSYVNDLAGPQSDLRTLDRADGVADGKWRGHELSVQDLDATPAFAPFENRTMKALLDREGFGTDGVTDLFYMNYKAPDGAGHLYNMIAPEQKDTLVSVDLAIRDMVDWLDEKIGRQNYVFILTADHGQTPLDAGGWPIRPLEMMEDLNNRFDHTANGAGIVEETSVHTMFLRKSELKANDVSADRIANFLWRYRIRDNIDPEDPYPPMFKGSKDARIYQAVMPGGRIRAVHRCAKARS